MKKFFTTKNILVNIILLLVVGISTFFLITNKKTLPDGKRIQTGNTKQNNDISFCELGVVGSAPDPLGGTISLEMKETAIAAQYDGMKLIFPIMFRAYEHGTVYHQTVFPTYVKVLSIYQTKKC